MPGSDVDLVVYGGFSDADAATVRAELEDSDLSIFADVLAYDAIGNDRLRAEIDRWAEILFTREDLLAAA
ncbi:hypothetical protein ASG29_11410 [Sphingomonas sp. Leaf412]|nr:hypothetical protein ASG29_11410 [Sphingomonas sp. Leaf412]